MFSEAAQFLKDRVGKEVTDSPSPFMSWLKPVMVEVTEGSLTFQYTVRHEMTNPFGTLHGGIISAIIDDAIGATLISYSEPFFYVSINLVVDFLASAREGDVILAQTSITKKGNQVVNAQCEVWNADRSKCIAKGYTNLLKTEIKK
ncbi:PaaI family thioesterase [Flavobacterium sp. DG1-102-2]|uniref:PaaI family thioesterase n=1 Tax=Flavobacterium sp. DG1-102-2 TaxID=3081663 RepID=UPI00294972D0|nr:PaaI family thioesterase [Flavobacterium sp. DG1-102-2]MDV6169454.1 PaaI family thioesterase [Flavobacterium sp. DG1-102-2]